MVADADAAQHTEDGVLAAHGILEALEHQQGGAGAGETPAKAPATAAAPAGAFGAPKPPPVWVKAATTPKAGAAPAPAVPPPDDTARAPDDGDEDMAAPAGETAAQGVARKQKYDRPARTGREAGKVTLFINVGRKQLVTPADIVGKIAGVTRLPASVVGAIDIHQRHTLADVNEAEADFIVQKLAGIKLKGIALAPTRAVLDGDAT